MAQSIIFFLLFILPFVIAPFGSSQFEIPKVIVGEVCILLLFISAIFSKSHSLAISRKALVPIVGIIALTLFHYVFLNSTFSGFGNVFRLQGVFVLWFLLLFSLSSSNILLKQVSWHIYAFLFFAELIALFILSTNKSGRFIGTLGEPNATAAFAVFLWPFFFFSLKKFGTHEKIGLGLVSLVICAILFLTDSKSAMVAFAIQLIFLFLQKLKVSLKRSSFICFILYGTSYALPFFDNSLYESRTQIWQAAFAANSNTFLLGHGFGNIEHALSESARNLGLLVQHSYVDSAHNIFLDWWVQGGLIGLLFLCSLLSLSFNRFINDKNKRELLLLFGLVTTLSFNPGSFVGLLGLWWLIGQGIRR